MSDDEEKIVIDLVPEEVHFECPDCGKDCVLHPRAQPMNARHSLPMCRGWLAIGTAKQIERGERTELTIDFIKRAGIRTFGGGTFG